MSAGGYAALTIVAAVFVLFAVLLVRDLTKRMLNDWIATRNRALLADFHACREANKVLQAEYARAEQRYKQAMATAQKYRDIAVQAKGEAAHWKHYAYQGGHSGSSSQKQFTSDEIKTLIRLCHPDKHNNNESATRITQKLNSMRSK